MDLQSIPAVGLDRQIMNMCGETCWIRFIDLNDKDWSGVVDFRTEKQLKDFVPKIKLSQFIKSIQLGRIKSLRQHRMNIKRHNDKNFKDQWKFYYYYYYGKNGLNFESYYSLAHSEKFINNYGRKMKLKVIKIV